MHRQLKYAVLLAGGVVLLIAGCDSARAETDGKLTLPDAAREAERLYETQLKDLHAEFEARKRKVLKAHAVRLTVLQQEYTEAGDHDGALAIRHRVEELKRPPKPDKAKKGPAVGLRMAELRGGWIFIFSNDTRHTRKFHGRNEVNNGARLRRRRGDLIIEYPQNVIERITLAEGRLFVEHFNPKNTYPKGVPAVLGIGTKLDR